MRTWWTRLGAVALLIGACAALAGTAHADGPYPDPGFPIVPCSSADQPVDLTGDAQLDPSCVYSGGIEITASDLTLDCRGASVAGGSKGVGIQIQAPADQDLSGVTVRNCAVSGFVNGIRVTREGFRDLEAGEEYDHHLRDVTLADNQVSDTRGVGIYVDGYVTGTTITGSTVSGAGSSGIYLEAGSADNLVTHNRILGNGFGENGPDGQLIKFGGLQFRYWGTGREGISVDGSRRSTISDNTLEGNSAGGIYLYTNCGEYVNSKPDRYFPRRYGATDNLIEGNHLIGGVSGVWVAARMGESVLPMECGDAPYYEDGLTEITLDRAAGNTVRDNVFEDVTYGIRVEDDDTKVIGNSFSGPDGGHYAVLVGTPYRTTALGRPVTGTQLIDNRSTITDNRSPYRWVEGEADTTVSGNSALGQAAGMCQGKSLPRGPFVMTIEIAFEPEGSPVTPTPSDLRIPTVGSQDACPDPDPPPDTDPPDNPAPPVDRPPSNNFRFGRLKLNKKLGGAILKVKVPGAGSLRLRGTKAIKGRRQKVGAARMIKVKIKARGKAARKLRRRGKARVKAVVTFTPRGGAARTRSRWVKLAMLHR